MALRRPAAHLRQTPVWRRSGDESYWEKTTESEGEVPLARVSRPERKPRPHSAIEGSHQINGWMEHLQRMQNNLLMRAPVQDQASAFSDQTSSMPATDKEHAWRQTGTPSYSRGSFSSCGSSTLCDSQLGSQESLQAGFFSPPVRSGSLERVHITQAPRKEQAQLSNLVPVKTGWLPVERKVMVEDSCQQNQLLDRSAGQVKLKQAITPTIQKTQVTANRHQDGEVERSHTSRSAVGVKMWQTPDQDSPILKQGPEKQSSPAYEGDRPVGWQALRRGWNSDRVSAFPRGSQSTETHWDPDMKTSPLMKTTSKPHTTNNTETYKSHTPLHRVSSVQPVRATAPLCTTNSSSSQPSSSRIQTSSAVTTMVPQNIATFSSITISSRKVSRSSSSPPSNTGRHSRESPSPPPLLGHHQSIRDPDSRQVTVQRKATIVKVTEQRMTSSTVPNSTVAATSSVNALDTVVHRRKATIIKVTEHSESYRPAKVGHPQNRHSYTEGLYCKENNSWGQHIAAPSYQHLDTTKRPSSALVSPNKSTSGPEKNGGSLHRSTLSLFVSTPPTTPGMIAAPAAPSEVCLRAAVSRRWDRPQSCHGNVFGHTEPSRANVTQPVARKWSYGLPPQETNINPNVNPDSGFIRPLTAAATTGAGQLVADTLKTNGGGETERLPPENPGRRGSLSFIKAPNPHSRQSPEEVLALNAALVIANIKLQNQLSKTKTPNGNSGTDSTASPRGNTDDGECMRPRPAQNPIQRHSHSQPNVAFVPPSLQLERSPETISLRDALQRSRPGFISRSQGRVRELGLRAQERRELVSLVDPQSDATLRQERRVHNGCSTSLNDNLFKLRDRAITGKEAQHRSKRTPAEVKRKKEDEKKREVCLSNRQRVELFKKKLLDQILQRSNS